MSAITSPPAHAANLMTPTASSRSAVLSPFQSPFSKEKEASGKAAGGDGGDGGSGQLIASASEIQYMLEGFADNCRADGRSCINYRPYTLHHQTEPLVLSNGSARVVLPGGSTDVLCSVKAEIVKPSANRPAEGVVELHVEDVAQQHTQKRRRDMRNTQLEWQSVLEKLLVSNAVDARSLCIREGQFVWRLSIDLLILACDGSLLDVASMAIRTALCRTALPTVTPLAPTTESSDTITNTAGNTRKRGDQDYTIQGDISQANPPNGAKDHCPIVVTVCLYHGEGETTQKPLLFIDASAQEEACASTRVAVAVDSQGRVCGVHKITGSDVGSSNSGSSLDMSMLKDVTEMAVKSSQTIFSNMEQNESNSNAQGVSKVENGTILCGHFEIR
jgi:exosome complex component RRP42